MLMVFIVIIAGLIVLITLIMNLDWPDSEMYTELLEA